MRFQRIHKENTLPLLRGTSVLVTADIDKDQIVDVFFLPQTWPVRSPKAFCHKAELNERRNYKLWKRVEAVLFL